MDALIVAAVAGLLGLPLGSLANMVIVRVPERRPVTHPASPCPSCGAGTAAGDSLPVAGWLLLRGRCRHCGARIPVRRPLVELAMGAVWSALALALWDQHPWALPTYLAFGFACFTLLVIDARTGLLPNRITYPAFAVTLVGLALASLLEGAPERLGRAVAAALLLGLVFLALAVVPPQGMGPGDAKFVPTIGLALGWLSWSSVVVGLFAAFLLGGLAALGAM